MPLLTSVDPLPTMIERVAQKAADNPALATIFEEGLEGVYHYQMLKQATLDNHSGICVKWRNFCEFSGRADLPAEIEPGVELVSEATCKEFVAFLAAGVKGVVSPSQNATRRTINNYINTWFAVWRRSANVPIPVPYRDQVRAFINSFDLSQVAPLSTAIRKKPVADEIDLADLTSFALNDRRFFRTNRARVQFNLVNIIAAETGERPGAILESQCYNDSNEALLWGDVTFFVIPNPTDPQNPHVAVVLLFRLPKAHRGEEEFYKSFIFLREPLGSRAVCLVTLFLYLALLSQVLGDGITDVEQIVRPERLPTKAFALTIKDEFKSRPVFLADELNEDGLYVTSETKALKATTQYYLLQKISWLMGYVVLLSMYCWRRAAAGNFNRELGADERKSMMTHGPNSNMFEAAYQSREFAHDLGGIFHGRGESQENLDIMKSVTGASVGRDSDTPTKLSLEGRAAMLREPELVKMREDIAKIKDDVGALVTQLAGLDVDSEDPDILEERAGLLGEAREKRGSQWQLKAKYDAIVNREEQLRLKLERDASRKTVALHQLQGKPAPSAPPMALARAPLADKTLAPNKPFVHTFVTSAGKSTPTASSFLRDIEQEDPIGRLCDILYHYQGDDIGLETAAAVNALLGLPERPFPPCYPGESPTADNKCPVCTHDCDPKSFSGSHTVGSHIHTCLVKAQQESAQRFIEDAYKPQKCKWDGCKRTSAFNTRAGFAEHLRMHIVSFSRPPSSKYPERVCRYLLENGEMCGDVEDDHVKHFGQVHSINVREKVEVHYCVTCPEWHVDELGDGLHWEAHCWDHFNELYEPFSVRVEGEVDLTPIGVEFTAAIDNAVEFQSGTGFGGVHPEFHGESARGVASIPMRCPWCVFDNTLSVEQKMHQFLTPSLFHAHLKTHDELIKDDDENICPVPSCGTHKFSRFDLMTHMVAFHRVPLCGSTNHRVVRRLRLPELVTVPVLPAVDLAHLHDDDEMDVDPVPVKKIAVIKGKQTERQIREANLKKARTEAAQSSNAIVGHCYGCSKRYDDIGKHLISSKCRSRNRYQEVVDNERQGPDRQWPLENAPPANSGRGAILIHKCDGLCRKQYADIRQHMDDPKCLPTHFSIKIPGAGRKFGPKILISDWVAQQNKVSDTGEGSSMGEGSSKRGPSDDDEDRGEGPSTAKKARVLQHPPANAMFVCNGCDGRFFDVDALHGHFSTLRKNSKCKKRTFRQRLPNASVGKRFGATIEWNTWAENPDLMRD